MVRPVITFEMSAGLDVQEQIQANTVIHPTEESDTWVTGVKRDGRDQGVPCINPKNLFHFGAKVADHRYCAPTVGSLGDFQ